MYTNMTGFSLGGIHTSLLPCALDESGHSIGRVINPYAVGGQFSPIQNFAKT